MPAKTPSSLSPSATTAELTTTDHKRLAGELTSLYHAAIDGHLRVLAFGARFLEVEQCVSTCGHAKGSNDERKGKGMKGWLDQYAPDISRPTAYRFRDIAQGVATKFNVKEPARFFSSPVAKLGGPEQAKRVKISAFMADKSMRQVQLELGLREGGKVTNPETGKRNHNPAKPATPAERHTEWVKAARARAVLAFDGIHTLDDRWKLLPDEQLKLALTNATKLAKELKAWLDTPEPVRIACEVERHLQEGAL